MDDGDADFMDGGDRPDQFHRNEAISAVADEAFLGDEDDDYDDLYNDVNIGGGSADPFHPSQPPIPGPDLAFPTHDPPKPHPPANGAALLPDPPSAPSDRDSSAAPTPDFPPKPPPSAPVGLTVKLGKLPEPQLPIGHLPPPPQAPDPHPSKLAEAQGQFGNNAGNLQGFGRPGGFGHGGGGGGAGTPSGPGGPSAVVVSVGGGGGSGGGTVLFVGELHWWTTDAQLESELSKYGAVKEVKFFDEKASGKSKGYCQVEFYDPPAAAACKEGMNGHVFNGRPCVVAFASPHTVRRMGEAQLNKNQAMTAVQSGPSQMRRGPGGGGGGDVGRGSSISTGGNYQNYGGRGGGGGGGGGWGRGGMGGRGPMGQMRNRVGMGGRGMIGNGGFGQGLAPVGPTPPIIPPQVMMGQGFDPTGGYGGMGRMGGYGGFPAGPVPPFSTGVLPSFPGVGSVGLPGVAPHVNPAFFGRGMPANGMGMMPGTGVEGQGVGMWSDPNMGGWAGEEQGGRAGDSSYGEDAASDHQYGDGGHERGGWSNSTKEKDRGPERDMPVASERRYRDEREHGWDRDAPREKEAGPDHDWSARRHRDDRDSGWDRDRDRERDRDRDRDRDRYRDDRERYSDHHRYRESEMEHDDEWDRGRSSRTHSKSRMSQEEERRRSRDIEHGKRRRLPSE